MAQLLKAALAAVFAFTLGACSKEETKTPPDKAFSEMTVDGFVAEKTLGENESAYSVMDASWKPASCKDQNLRLAAEIRPGQTAVTETVSSGRGISSRMRQSVTVKNVSETKYVVALTAQDSYVVHQLYRGPIYPTAPYEDTCTLSPDTDGTNVRWRCRPYSERPLDPQLDAALKQNPEAFGTSRYCTGTSFPDPADPSAKSETVTQVGTYPWHGETRAAVMTKRRNTFLETCRSGPESDAPVISSGKTTHVSIDLYVKGVLNAAQPSSSCSSYPVYMFDRDEDSLTITRVLDAPTF